MEDRAVIRCPMALKLPPSLHPLFWDHAPEVIDSEAHASLVLERVLEYGTLADARWALATYGPEKIGEFLRRRGLRTLSRKTLAFWTTLLHLEGEACFQPSSLRRSRAHWDF
jgi:hypothetical protein